MATTLQQGMTGPEVRTLQQTLNARLTPSPNLRADGVFGPLTRIAVLRFQAGNWLVEDGYAGPATQACLYGYEAEAPILHRVSFIPQPTQTTCWAASTAMMTNSTVDLVKAKTPTDMWDDTNGLYNSSGSDQAIVTGQRYGRIHGLRCFAPMSWSVDGLTAELRRGPLMFDMLWNSSDYARGAASPGHMIVVVGVRGDGDDSGLGTTLRIQDPWPPGVGKIYSRGYAKWATELPTMTYRVFAKI